MRILCTIIITITLAIATVAAHPICATTDSLKISEKFSYQQLVVPSLLVATGWLGTRETNIIVRDQFAKWRGDNYFHADDYLQYFPLISYLGLGCIMDYAYKLDFPERVIALATSYAATGIFVNVIKHTVREKRPDSSAHNSFPSGHTATAFMGAELIRREYGLGYGIAAYAVATGVGVLRIYNDRHWLGDVITGAGIGILGAEIGYWLLPYVRELLGIKKGNNTVVMVPTYTYARGICIGQLALHIPFG